MPLVDFLYNSFITCALGHVCKKLETYIQRLTYHSFFFFFSSSELADAVESSAKYRHYEFKVISQVMRALLKTVISAD